MSLSDIPPEINYNIISHLHPYHLNASYCRVNIDVLQQCEDNKYDILQIWCYPNMSTFSLRQKYPNLSWKTVVELSLLHHPITASISSYDSFTLTFRSLQQGNADMAIYFYNYVSNYLFHEYEYEFPARGLLFTITVCLYCYKYNMNIFDRLEISNLQVNIHQLFEEFRAAMEYRKTKAPPTTRLSSFHDNDYYLGIMLYNSDIFTPPELCEFITIMNTVSNNTGIRTCYLGMIGRDPEIAPHNPYVQEFDSLHSFGLDIGIYLGAQDVAKIINNLGSGANILVRTINAQIFPLSVSVPFYGRFGTTAPGLADIVNIRNKFPSLLQVLTDPFQKAVLCITAGMFDEYFKLRDAGLQLKRRNFAILQDSIPIEGGGRWDIVSGLNWPDLEAVSSPLALMNLLNSVGGYIFNNAGFISSHADLAEILPGGFGISYLLDPINYDITISFSGIDLSYRVNINNNNIEEYYSEEHDNMEE